MKYWKNAIFPLLRSFLTHNWYLLRFSCPQKRPVQLRSSSQSGTQVESICVFSGFKYWAVRAPSFFLLVFQYSSAISFLKARVNIFFFCIPFYQSKCKKIFYTVHWVKVSFPKNTVLSHAFSKFSSRINVSNSFKHYLRRIWPFTFCGLKQR